MGNCQARICGDLLVHALAGTDHTQHAHTHHIQDLGFFSVRPPIHPMTVQDLAQSAISKSEMDLDR